LMDSKWTRRKFLSGATISAASIAIAASEMASQASGTGTSSLRGRILTHISLVRVNQIEVTPTRSIGEDEAPTTALTASDRAARLLNGAAQEAG
jgi:hypothetical protein